MQRLRCAKLRLELGERTAAQVHLVLATMRLAASHGRGSRLYREAFELQAQHVAPESDEGSDSDYDWRSRVPRR